MTTEASNNNPDLLSRRADLKARITRARDAIDFADRCEREAAQFVTTLRTIAHGDKPVMIPRVVRRNAGKNAQHIKKTIPKSAALVRVQAKAVLADLLLQLDHLTGDAS